MGRSAGWGSPVRPAVDPWGDAGRAAAVSTYCAVAVVAATARMVVLPSLKSSDGAFDEPFVLCLLPPALIPLWACAVAASLLHALPATVLGLRLAARTGRPRWLCLLAAEAATAAVLAVPVVWLGGPYLPAWLCIAGAGAAPVLVTSFYAGRRDSEGRTGWARQRQVAFQISVVAVALIGVVFAGGLLAYGTGLLEEYRPPPGASVE
ncbi:hypothetical protein ABZZ36_05060 [Actinacidiphila glaucinigra]|uniref:hypothetical protein n=1 Tax=Actinacidiphila glaucinigra TaxID=235986 RepID=UPI0033AC42C5